MPFEKGISGNMAGRPKGTPNKATNDLRKWITSFIEENREQIKADWKTLEPKDRLMMFEKLLKFALPTLQAQSLDIGFERLPDEQLNELFERVVNSHNGKEFSEI
ncbi:MAG TPA: hypothetical protein PLC62_00755 [Chitinophagaceae bacterium]|jgi:hypothetical protein|nr:hypothetical protein [Chitinophagaceae bacterium]HNJ54938.1 hypothetical protein [Chitinophagaceae bacterium]